MPIQKLILICIVFACALLGSVLAADKPSAQADMDKLQEQVRTLDKELAVQREAFVRKLDDVEKRQIEITAQQANSLAAIANQTTALGNYIAYTSAAITVIVFIAGIATYFSAKSKAEKEARVSSKQWFDQNAADLKQEIENLRAATLDGSGQIRSHVAQFQADADVERKKVIEITEASRTLLQSTQVTTGDEPISVTNQLALTTVQDAREALKAKPESQFTASDFYARGLAYFSESNYQSALSSFEDAVKLVDISSTPAQLAQYLFAKGVTLGQLDKSQDAIAVYDDLDKRFGADTTPAVREVVARGLFNKGFRLDKSQDAIAVYDDLDRRFGADTTPAVRELVARGLNAAGFNRILLAKQCWPDEERRVAACSNRWTEACSVGTKRRKPRNGFRQSGLQPVFISRPQGCSGANA